MAKLLSVLMNKGGVGKTSLITNMAAVLAKNEPNARILIVDTDGQGNASMSFGLSPTEYDENILDVFLGEKRFSQVNRIKVDENIDLIPANNEMNFVEFRILTNLKQYKDPYQLLAKSIEDIKDQYDYILFDTPPSIGLVTLNVLSIVDSVIIPFVPEWYSVQGLIRVIETIEEFKETNQVDVKIDGVVGMMIDSRTVLHGEMLQEARKYCDQQGINLYDSVIPKSIKFANSTVYKGKPAVMTERRSEKIVSSYFELTEEVMSV